MWQSLDSALDVIIAVNRHTNWEVALSTPFYRWEDSGSGEVLSNLTKVTWQVKWQRQDLNPRDYDTRTRPLTITPRRLYLLITLWKKWNQTLPGSKLDSSPVCMDQINLKLSHSQNTSNRMKLDDIALESCLCLGFWRAQSKTGQPGWNVPHLTVFPGTSQISCLVPPAPFWSVRNLHLYSSL